MGLRKTSLVFKTMSGNSVEEAFQHFKEISPEILKEKGWTSGYNSEKDYIVHWEDDSDEEVAIEMWFIYELS